MTFILTCPTCGKRATYDRMDDARDRPFCSERCRMVDLGKWLGEEYRVSEPERRDHPGALPDPERDSELQ